MTDIISTNKIVESGAISLMCADVLMNSSLGRNLHIICTLWVQNQYSTFEIMYIPALFLVSTVRQ